MSTYNLDDILNSANEANETNLKNRNARFEEDSRVLRFKIGNKYTGRFIPNIHDLRQTFVDYDVVAFNSFSTGKYVFLGRSPKNAGIKKDIINDLQWSTFETAKKTGDEDLKKKSFALIPKREEVTNFLLLAVEGNDEDAKAKIGQVVVIKYPAQLDKEQKPRSDLYKKIYPAIHGDKKAKIGKKAFDLSGAGKSFTISVEKNAGGWADYSGSEFEDAEDTPYTAEKVYPTAHNLVEFIPAVKSDEEIKTLLDEHFHCTDASPEDNVSSGNVGRNLLDELDTSDDTDIPGLTSGDSTDDLDSILEGLK